MRRLWKQVKASQTFQHVFPLSLSLRHLVRRPRDDLPNVPRLRVHVTANIHDGLRAKPKQLSYERLVAALTRWIHDERGAGGRKVRDGAKDLSRVARAEGHFVREAVECRVVRCKADRVRGELDSGDLCEVRGKCEREEACAAVCVYEVCRGQVA